MTRLTPEEEAEYALDYGVSKADLPPAAQAEYDRLLGFRRAALARQSPSLEQPPHPQQTPARPEKPPIWTFWTSSDIWSAVKVLPRWLLVTVCLLMLGSVIGVPVYSALAGASRGIDIPALQEALAEMRFPPGYHLVAQHRKGVSADCPDGRCWVTQKWEWSGDSQRTVSAACQDVLSILSSAYGSDNVFRDSPMPAGARCDYTADVPSAAKPVIQAVIKTSQAHVSNDFAIYLTAFYP